MSYLFTAFQTIEPLSIGTTCVKLNPESTMSMHSGEGSPSSTKRFPCGTRAAAKGPRDYKKFEG